MGTDDLVPPPRSAASRWPRSITALRHRNFRLIWLSQLVSMAGTMMQNAAILWHVSLLAPPHQRGLALGMVGLVRILPIVGFSLLAGVVADAMDRRRLMLVTQAGMTIAAGLLAWTVFAGVRSLWIVYALAAFGAAFASFDSPARMSLIAGLVPREHLPNAISLNSIMFQAASVAGPALGGLVIARSGVGWAYAANALSFLFVIGALLAMRDLPPTEGARGEVSLRSAREGLEFVFRNPLIRGSMLLDFIATFFASATALLPIFAQDILKVGAQGYGVLSAAPSLGAFVTSIALVPLIDRIERRGVTLLWAVMLYGAATVAFGFSRVFALTFACLALTGAADMVSTVIRNIIRQLHTPDAMRGRMSSVVMTFFMGGPQLGEMEAGLAAQIWSAPISVISGGIGCMLGSGLVAWRTPSLARYHATHDRQASGASPTV